MAEETKHLGKQVVKTCAVCGGDNPSFADLLATCTQCGICEHGYCMRELTHNIPDDWICESCDETESSGEEGSEEDTLLSPSSSSSSDGHHEITQLPISSIVCGKTSPTRSKKERPVGTGKVKFIPAEEVIRLTSGASENKSCILISKPGHANSDTVASLKSPKISSVAPNFSSICIPSRPRTPRPGITPISSIFNEQASQQTIKELKEKRAAAVPTKEHAAEKYMKERERSKEREAREKAEILKKKKENDERKEMKDKEPNEARCTLSPAEHSPLDIAGKSKQGAVPTKEHAAEKHMIEREKAKEREAREKHEILKKKENDERKEMKDKEPNEALCSLSPAEHSPLDIAGKSKKVAVPTKEHAAEKYMKEKENSKEREAREKAEILKKKENNERQEMKDKEPNEARCTLSPVEHSPLDIAVKSKQGAVLTKEHAAENHMIEREKAKEREAREKPEILKKKANDERKEMKDKEPNEALCTLSPAEHSLLDIAGKSKKGAVPTKEHAAEKHIEREKLKEREAREKAEILKKKENNEWKEMRDKVLKEALCTLSPAEHSPLDIAGKNNQDGGQQATLNMLRLYHIYLPALKTTWKGEFIIPNRNAPGLGGLVAQPPCKVHRKVLEFSQKMPSVLQFNMLPRLHIWADLFHNGSPDLRDVALYFFNADDTERSKQGYFELFECLETQNSMLRSYIDGVELLIFTSKQLNSDSQYILVSKLEFFFWGVFRRAKNKTNEEPSLSVTCADEKMEVDMIGGKDVRRVDVAVKRENHGVRRSNIPSCPPGFPEKKTTSCLAAEAPEIRHNKTLKGDSPNASLGRGDIHGVRRINATSRLTCFPEKITASCLAAKAKQVDYGSSPPRQNKTMKGDPPSLCRDSSQSAINSPNAGLRRDDNHGVRRTNVPSFLPGSPEIKAASFSAKEQNVHSGGSLQRENKRLKGNPPGFRGDSSSPDSRHGRNDIPTRSPGFRKDSSSPNAGDGRNDIPTRSPGFRGDSSSPNAGHGRNDIPTHSPCFHGDSSSPNTGHGRNDIPSRSPDFRGDRSSPGTGHGRNDIPSRSPDFRGDRSSPSTGRGRNDIPSRSPDFRGDRSSPSTGRGRNDIPTCSPGFRKDNSRSVITSPNASHVRNDIPTRSPGFLKDSSSPNASNGRNDIPTHSPGFRRDSSSPNAGHGRNDNSTRSPGFHRDSSSPNTGHGRNDIPSRSPGFRRDRSSPNTGCGRNDSPTCSPGFRGGNTRSVITSPNASHGRNDTPTRSPGFRRDNSRSVITSPNASHGRNDIPTRSPGFLENKTRSPLSPVKAERSVITSPNASHGRNDIIPAHSPGFLENRTRSPLPPVQAERSVITPPNASHGRNDTPARSPGFLENKTRSPFPAVKAERSNPEQSVEREYTRPKLKTNDYLPTGNS